MKALSLAIIILAVVLLLAVGWRLAGGQFPRVFDGFITNARYLTVSWTPPPNYPFPQNLNYNWAFCMAPGPTCQPTGSPGTGMCPTPLGDPTTWNYHGTVTAPSVVLNGLNCGACVAGCKGTFMLQAFDPVIKTTGPWTTTVIDLTYPMPVSVSITDSAGQPITEGDTSFVYTLTLTPAAFAEGNNATLMLYLSRGLSYFNTSFLPFSTVSGGTATLDGSLTASTWLGGAPGPLQLGDKLTVYAYVYSPEKNGQVYYWNSFAASAQVATPGSPTQVSWTLT